MDYFKFNRHKVMTAEQRADILMILNRNFRMDFSLRNEIYGLFDGYFYQDIVTKTITDSNISSEDKTTLTKIYQFIQDNIYIGKLIELANQQKIH